MKDRWTERKTKNLRDRETGLKHKHFIVFNDNSNNNPKSLWTFLQPWKAMSIEALDLSVASLT